MTIYVNVTIGEDPEGNPIIYRIIDATKNPRYNVCKDAEDVQLEYGETKSRSIETIFFN